MITAAAFPIRGSPIRLRCVTTTIHKDEALASETIEAFQDFQNIHAVWCQIAYMVERGATLVFSSACDAGPWIMRDDEFLSQKIIVFTISRPDVEKGAVKL